MVRRLTSRCGFPERSARLALTILFAAAALHAQTRHDVFIHLSGGDSLDATYFVPPQSPPSAGFPAILFVHGFGTSKATQIPSCSVYAASGYLTFAFTVRGHGASSGVSTIMATQERRDLAEVVRFLKDLPDVDTSLVGITGGSQGGLHGLWAAADRLGVAAIASDLIVPPWASDMLMNGSVRRTLTLLLQTSTVRYAPVRDTLWSLVQNDSYDSLLARFPKGRDLDTTMLNSATTPLLRFLKWQDYYFTPATGIASFLSYAGSSRLYLGTQGHFSDAIPAEQLYQADQIYRWFGYYLRGEPTGILEESPITYAYSSLPMDSLGYFAWTRDSLDSWPPPGIQPVRFYFAPGSQLLPSPSLSQSYAVDLPNEYLNTSYTFATGFIEGFQGSRFDAALPKQTIVFESSPLESDLFWIGEPLMTLFLKSQYSKFPVNAQIYEVDSLGTKYFINRINYTARHWAVGSEQEVSVRGIPHAHRFRRGDRLRIELTNIDRTNRIEIGSYPYIVPMFAQAGVTIEADASHPSFIELPMSGSPPLAVGRNVSLPVSYQLFQNYPNPFNPTTVISFFLPVKSDVSVSVEDLLGRTIATLEHGTLNAGTHQIVWNASRPAGDGSVGLSSGVYFSTLVAEPSAGNSPPTRITRKMMLIR